MRFLSLMKYARRDIYVHPESNLGSNTTIGNGTKINGPAFIASREDAPVEIGKYCAIAHGLRIRPRNHYTGYANLQDRFQLRYNFPSLSRIKGPVPIGNNVWIGDNVTILSGICIGVGAVIGAGSIVTKSIEAYSIAVGSPAKVIRKRFSDEIIDQLLKIDWWNWSNAKIQRNHSFFEKDLSKESHIDLFDLILE